MARRQRQMCIRDRHYLVLDLRMPGPSGLTLISRLRLVGGAGMRIVVTTGYASIATAVEAIKLGARHDLARPVDGDGNEVVFQRDVEAESKRLYAALNAFNAQFDATR